MNITKRKIWKLLIRIAIRTGRACEDITKDLGIGQVDAGDIAFTTPEAAVAFGKLVLQKLVDLTPLCNASFADKNESNKALNEVGIDHQRFIPNSGARQESRWAADPQITWDSARGSIVMERGTEVRWVMNQTVRKEIQVEGETWTREFIETRESSWYPGKTEITVFHVWSEELVEIG